MGSLLLSLSITVTATLDTSASRVPRAINPTRLPLTPATLALLATTVRLEPPSKLLAPLELITIRLSSQLAFRAQQANTAQLLVCQYLWIVSSATSAKGAICTHSHVPQEPTVRERDSLSRPNAQAAMRPTTAIWSDRSPLQIFAPLASFVRVVLTDLGLTLRSMIQEPAPRVFVLLANSALVEIQCPLIALRHLISPVWVNLVVKTALLASTALAETIFRLVTLVTTALLSLRLPHPQQRNLKWAEYALSSTTVLPVLASL